MNPLNIFTINISMLLMIINCIDVYAQHNQWVEPIMLQGINNQPQSDWDNSNNDKLAPIAYDNNKSTYIAGDYRAGRLLFGENLSGPEMSGDYSRVYISKIDSSGSFIWVKSIMEYLRDDFVNPPCISRIHKLAFDSVRNRIMFSFKSCRNNYPIDSYNLLYGKSYLGAISVETGVLEFLQEIPIIYNFYLSNNYITALTGQYNQEIIEGITYERGIYLTKLDYSGNLISRTRIVNPDPDPTSPAQFITGVVIKDIFEAPLGNTIVVGTTNAFYKHSAIVGTTLLDTVFSNTLFVMNLSPNGETVWSKLIYSTKPRTNWHYGGVNTKVNPDGSSVLSSQFYNDVIIDNELHEYEAVPGNFYANTKCFILKINPVGQTVWSKLFEAATYPNSIDQNKNGEIVFASAVHGRVLVDNVYYVSQDSLIENRRILLLKFDSLGNVINSRVIQGNGYPWQVKSINESEQIVYGRYYNYSNNDSIFQVGNDGFNVKYNGGYGFFVARVDFNDVPQQTRLSSEELLIYANPNTGSCQIRVPIDFYNASILFLDIYNESGQIISKNTLNFQKEDIKLDIAAHANGIYPVRLSNGNKSYFGKIILVK